MNLENKRVVVIGDSILDETVFTEATGLSLESPTLKVREVKTQVSLGGAANVVNNLLQLGAVCTFVTVVGRDEYKSYFDSWRHPNLTLVPLVKNQVNTVKTRVWVQRGDDSYKYLQINRSPTKICSPKIDIKPYLKGVSSLLLVDYGLGIFKNVSPLLKAAKKQSVTTIASSQLSDKGNRYGLFKDADLFCMNEKEASIVGSFEGCTTKGSSGCIFRANGQVIEHPGFIVDSKDSCGAGDSFLAALSLVVDNIDVESLAFCNAWAAMSTTKIGTGSPTLKEAYELLRNTEV